MNAGRQPAAIVVRDAVPADDGAVGELLVAAYMTQYARKLPDVQLSDARLADLRDQADKRTSATVLVAEVDGRIAGAVTIYPPNAPRSEAWIPGAADLRFLAVAVDLQGRGLSHRLLDEAEQRAREWHVPAICLHVRRGAEGVARLYMSRGYRRDEAGDIDKRPMIFLEAYALSL